MKTITVNVSDPIYRDFTVYAKQVGRIMYGKTTLGKYAARYAATALLAVASCG